jgi:hypothetical protein
LRRDRGGHHPDLRDRGLPGALEAQAGVGIGIGFVAIQSLNLVRIISLFYLGQYSRVWFDWFHLYLWQALIVLDALAVWLIWLRYLPRPARRSQAADRAAGARRGLSGCAS